ncbi:hypothetical protein INR76_05890 [Marixanthomonas sp. SCSIO 43207]|uniref:hypothetical protein n=1 Tax=Marixanthomonas sp. SCSIO 43207 TaxID=2779360 RepID=UPI001CAA3DA0|nr:hypothetical protein [Marixanthomonas sp. SCSIO 43207]UAB82290.1 hypothetical protein INR76_05890 [Marixanthomonas sp. SCSIO 43207]
MKNIYWILILISFQSFAQNGQWFDFELDKNVRFKLPAENANLFDSEQDGIKMYELSAEKNDILYSGNKMLIDEQSLPNSKKELISLYEEAVPNISKSYPNTTVSKQEINKNGLIGQKLTLTDSSGNRLYESEVYLMNNQLFLFNWLIPTLIIIVFGIIAYRIDFRNFKKTYFHYKTIKLYALINYFIGFGFIACSVFMFMNYHFADRKSKKESYKIVERTFISGGTKYRSGEKQPVFTINHKGIKKELVFNHQYFEKMNQYKTVELETRNGLFGFDILENKKLN